MFAHPITYLLLLLVCCGGTPSAHARQVVLAGKINNAAADSVVVTYNNNLLAWYPVRYSCPLAADGSFKLRFAAPANAYTLAELQVGNHVAEFAPLPADSLYLLADARRFDSSITYSGKGAARQNFIAAHTLSRGRVNNYMIRLRNHIGLSPTAYTDSIAAELQRELAFVSKHAVNEPAFLSFWERSFQYFNYFFIQQYPGMHQAYVLRRLTDTIPDSLYTITTTMPTRFADDMLGAPSYLLYLSGYFEAQLKSAGMRPFRADTAGTYRLEDSMLTLAYKQLPPQSSSYFAAQFIYARCRVQPLHRVEQLVATYQQHTPTSPHLETLLQQLSIARRLAPGMPAPQLPTLYNDALEVVANDSLMGKVVYVSFWASFCKPCLADMRLTEKKIKTIFSSKPVVFVYVSIDRDTAKATKLWQQSKVGGLLAHAPEGWYHSVVKDFGVQSLPAYYLLTKNGTFAQQNVPSPAATTELIVAISRQL